jgi:hypothetical protein
VCICKLLINRFLEMRDLFVAAFVAQAIELPAIDDIVGQIRHGAIQGPTAEQILSNMISGPSWEGFVKL